MAKGEADVSPVKPQPCHLSLWCFKDAALKESFGYLSCNASELGASKVSNKCGWAVSYMGQKPKSILCCLSSPSFYWALKLAVKTQVSAVPLVPARWAIKNARKKWILKSPCLSEGRVLPNYMAYHIFFSSTDGCLLSKSDGHRDKDMASALNNHWSFTPIDYLLGVANIKKKMPSQTTTYFLSLF